MQLVKNKKPNYFRWKSETVKLTISAGRVKQSALSDERETDLGTESFVFGFSGG